MEASSLLLKRFQESNGGEIVGPSVQITGQQLGGAAMGEACDSFGRLNNQEHLYVVDGSLIPGSSNCMNPALTIAAVAERAMENII